MRFIVKPDDDSLDMFLEAANYHRIWKQHSRRLLKALRETTGLDMQDRVVTARVFARGKRHTQSGSPWHPMMLEGGYETTDDIKLWVLVHEMSHRFIASNYLDPRDLFLLKVVDNGDERFSEMGHRHLYLFEYDMLRNYFGGEFAEQCKRLETNIPNGPYTRAWEWAMSMTYEERQAAVKILASQAVPRDRWQELLDNKRPVPDPGSWYHQLNPRADPAIPLKFAESG